MPKLLTDIYSVVNNKRKYGSKGDEVKIISDRRTVLILEDKKGNRFTVKKNEIEND